MIIVQASSLNMCLGNQKNRLVETVLLNETVLLSTHNICWMRNKKIIFYILLAGGLF